jgi:hypothetical protein
MKAPLSVAFVLLALASPAAGQPRIGSRTQPGTTIKMNDAFEYQMLDYGLGIVEERDVEGHIMALDSHRMLWLKFKVTNTSPHLLGSRLHLRHFRGQLGQPVLLRKNLDEHSSVSRREEWPIQTRRYGVRPPHDRRS